MPTTARRCAAILILALSAATPARAGDVAIRYLVERTPLRTAPATAPVTVELHADAACNALITSEPLTLQAFHPIIDVKRLKLRGARPVPRVVELRHVVGGVPAVATIYARIVGADIVPAGDACQVQAFIPPPAVAQPIARDATGTAIGVLSNMSTPYMSGDAQTAMLRDDGHGVYGLAIGSTSFAAFDDNLLFASADCTGAPFLPSVPVSILAPTALDTSGVFHGPGGPPALLAVGSVQVGDGGCFEETPPEPRLAVPALPLDLDRFVRPFHIDHAPTP